MFKSLAAVCTILVTVLLHTAATYSQTDVSVLALDWSPDGTQIVVGDNRGSLAVWDVASGACVQTLQGHTQEIMTLQWSPNGTQIASGSPDGTLRIWDALSGETLNTIQFSQPDGGFRAILDIDWSPDSALIAGARETGQVIIWDARTGEQHASYFHDGTALGGTASKNMVLTVAWGPLGDVVASGGLMGDILLWDTTDQSLSEFTPVSSATLSSIDSIAWSPDGERIAVGKGLIPRRAGVEVYNFSTRELLYQIPQVSEGFVFVEWNPNGTELAISNPSGLMIVNSSTGDAIERLDASSIFDSFAWSPYGGRLAIRNSTSQSVTATSRLESAVQIIVPAPSLERLQAIADACSAPAAVEQSLTADIQAGQLTDFVARVEALPEGTIPPACAADLIAVAEALQSR